MKTKILIILFITQIITFGIGLVMMVLICLKFPNAETLKPFCIGTFFIGTLIFVITQALFSFFKKSK